MLVRSAVRYGRNGRLNLPEPKEQAKPSPIHPGERLLAGQPLPIVVIDPVAADEPLQAIYPCTALTCPLLLADLEPVLRPPVRSAMVRSDQPPRRRAC